MYPFAAIQMPQLRIPELFMGQMGVPGTDLTRGIRMAPKGVVLYVDPSHPMATDANDGTDPEAPLATIQGAVDRLVAIAVDFDVEGSVIMLEPNNAFAESVVTPEYDDGPNYITIMGRGGPYASTWASGAATEFCLDLRALGWRISGVRFLAPTQAGCIELHHTDLGGNDIAIRTIIEKCLFDGQTTGRYGIVSHGCYDVWIMDNVFQLFHNAVAGGAVPLSLGTTPLTIPYRNHILRNCFWDCDNGAIFPMNGGEVAGNLFQPVGYAYAMTQVLNTSIVANPGDDNVVWGNVFPGDYSIAGGYRGGAADAWINNMAEDVAAVQVADNGWTIARPA